MASSALGLRASRNMFSPTVTRAAMGATISRTVAAQLAIRGSRFHSTRLPRTSKDAGPAAPSVQRHQQHLNAIEPSVLQMMLPGTLVTPPLSQWPRTRKEFFGFLWDVIKNEIRGKFQIIMMSISSKKGILKPRRFKLNNAQIILTAKAMHREMAEAVAAGNTDTINKICVKSLAIPLMTTVDQRPKSQRYEWELVRYNGWRNPKIVSQVLAPVAVTKGAPLVRQVVVRIKSRQRRTTFERSKKGSWEVKPGSQQETDLVEHMVMVSVVNPNTWTSSEWRIMGSIQPTSYADWRIEMETLAAVEAEELKNYKL